jgi:hypothetical protein
MKIIDLADMVKGSINEKVKECIALEICIECIKNLG